MATRGACIFLRNNAQCRPMSVFRGRWFIQFRARSTVGCLFNRRKMEIKRRMKHVKVLSKEVPVLAQQTAWIELKNIVGFSVAALSAARNLFTKQTTPPPNNN